MAQFQLLTNIRVNSFGLGDYGLAAVAASAGSLVYTLDDTVLTVNGAFTLSAGEAVAGTISQIRLDVAGVEQFLISGAALQLQTFFDAMGNDAFPDLLASYDTILGTDLGNRLNGFGGDDVLSGAAGDDALFGGTGSDVLFGGIGDDRMQGGTGNDVYSVDAVGDRVVELRNAGIDRVETTLTTYTLGAHVENLSYLGTDAFTGTGNALDNVIIGGAGDDQINGLDGDDTLRGGNGDDTLTGGNGNDWLVGDAGASFVTTTASDTSGSQTITLSMTLPEIATSTTTTVTGYINNATLSEAVFNLAFVLDVSGSMADNFSGSNVGDVNGDGANNTKLDAAIAGFEALIASLQAAGLGSTVRISLIPFSDSGSVLAQGDVTTDNDGNGVADVIDAARSLRTISGTNYDGGLSQAAQFFQNAERGNNYVFFLSDGQPNNQNYDADLATLRNPDGINASIRSLGFEAASYYDVLDKLDDGLLNHSAIDVLAPADLTAGLLNSQFHVADIARLEILLNGTVIASLTPDQLIETPFGLKYSYSIPGLTPGGADKIETRIVPADPLAGYISTSQVISGGTLNSDDRLVGGAGDDTLDGGAGIDTLIGGAGDDVYQVESTADVITEAANAGTDRIESKVSYSLNPAALAAIENLSLLGSGNLSGTGNALANKITGNLGNNLLEGLGGSDTLIGGYGRDMASYEHSSLAIVANLVAATVVAGSETDLLIQIEDVTGSAFADKMTGDAGDNRFVALSGNDTVDGGDGNDMLDMSRATASVTVNLNQTYGGLGSSSSGNGAEGTDQISNIENVLGSRFADTISDSNYYNGLDNLFYGGAGSDRLYGGYGSDTLYGGAGNDTLDGGTAYSASYNDIDLLDYSDATAALRGTLGGVVVSAGLGRDTVKNFEHVIATDFADNLTGSALNEWIEGGNGADRLRGGAGNDTLDGGKGRDTLIGDAGDDLFIVDAAGDSVSENAGQGNDTVQSSASYILTDVDIETLLLTGTANLNGTGNTSANMIIGNDGDNILSGLGGADTLSGGDGNDTILGGDGADSMDGGDGRDLVSFAGSASSVNGTLSSYGGASFLTLSGTDTVRNFEDITGSSFNDILGGDSNNNQILGGAGDDQLTGGSGNDTLFGDTGDDTLDGGYGFDAVSYANLLGTGINANLTTGIIAGEGTDTLLNQSVEQVTGTGLADVIAWTNALTGTYTDFALLGGAGNDTLTGSNGDDTLDGGQGADLMTGGSGYDLYIVDNIDDQVIETDIYGGTDTIRSSLTKTTLGANVENLELTGTAVTGIGNDLYNVLTGNDKDNVLRGGLGSDTLTGAAGADTLDAGADTNYDWFIYNSASDSTLSHLDVIENFVAGYDRFNFSDIDADTTANYEQSFTFIGAAAFGNVAGQLRYEFQGSKTLILGDTDGDGIADFAIAMTGLYALQSSSFYL